jgi:hypothetical protein
MKYDGGPLARRTLDGNVAPRLLCEPMDLCQSQTCTASWLFSRKEWLKYSGEHPRGHARTVIPELDVHILAVTVCATGQYRVSGLYRDMLTFSHGIMRVYSEVEQSDLELTGVEPDWPKVRIRTDGKDNVRP